MSRGLSHPFRIGDLGVPAGADRSQLIRDQIEQLLFTIPGERVNRPTFGCGVQRLVFSAASPEAAAAAEYVVGTAIRRHLRDLVRLDAARASVQDSTLYIDILYTDLETGDEQAATFTHTLQGAP